MYTHEHAKIIAEAKRMRRDFIVGFFTRLFRNRKPHGALRHS